MADIVFTRAALDDLRRIGPVAVPKVLKKLLILVDDPMAGYPLGGHLTGYRKLIVGRNTWRVVYRLAADDTVEVCEVWAVGPRANGEIYRETVDRVAAAEDDRPEWVALAKVVQQLGRLADQVPLPEAGPTREPVPNWLADRLVRTVGLSPVEVAAMDLQQAVDRWTAFMSGPPLIEAKQRIERAAELLRMNASDFARSAVEERADEVLRQHEQVTTVPAEFFDDLLRALGEPVRPNPVLRDAAQRATTIVEVR